MGTDDRRERLINRLAILAPGEPPLQQICRGCVTMVDVSGAAVVLMSEQESGAVTAAFGASVVELEDLQFILGEGPCLEAFQGGTPVFASELGGGPSDRWPEFARRARALGARAVFVLLLQLGAIRLGVLYLYRDRPGMLSAEQLADGFALADMAMLTVLELQSHAPPGELGVRIGDDWAHHAAVHQATGVVAVQLNTRLADALARIRAYAFASDRPIYRVAADIVSGVLRLER